MENGLSDLDSERRIPTGNRSYRFGRPLLTPPRPYWFVVQPAPDSLPVSFAQRKYRFQRQAGDWRPEAGGTMDTTTSALQSPVYSLKSPQASSPGVEPGLRPSQGRVPPSHSEDFVVPVRRQPAYHGRCPWETRMVGRNVPGHRRQDSSINACGPEKGGQAPFA